MVCDIRGSDAALLIVEIEPGANIGFGLGYTRIGVEVDLLVFAASPQPLDEDVVHAPALAVHADRNPTECVRARPAQWQAADGAWNALPGVERQREVDDRGVLID